MKPKFLIILTLFSVFTGCKYDPNCPDRVSKLYYLYESEKNKVPYTGKDTLRFVSSTNDTAVLIGQGVKGYFEYNPYGEFAGDCGNLPPDGFEVNEVEFKSNSILNSLKIGAYEKLYYTGGATYNCIKIQINGKNFYFYFDNLDNKTSNNFLESKKFNSNNIFNQLYFVLNEWNVTSDSIFYNQEFGLCGFYVNGKLWEYLP